MVTNKINFTQTRLENLAPADKVYFVADTAINGLRCKVMPSGYKSLLVYKRPKGSKSPVTVKICNVGDKLLDAVRAEARNILNDLSQGINPNQTRAVQARAEGQSLRSSLNEYSGLKASTKRGYQGQLERNLKEYLDQPLHVLSNAQLLRQLKRGMTGSNGNYVMRIVRMLLNHEYNLLFEMDADQELLNKYQWPIKSSKFWAKEQPRTNYIQPADLGSWWAATEKLQPLWRDYLQFVLLTGLRRREATGLLSENINYNTKTFTVLNTKNGTDHTLPMSDYVEVLLKRSAPVDVPSVFYIIERMEKLCGLHVSVHDLRRSFVSYATTLNLGVYTIKALVNHGGNADITQRYTQVSIEQLRQPMQQITDFVLNAVKGVMLCL